MKIFLIIIYIFVNLLVFHSVAYAQENQINIPSNIIPFYIKRYSYTTSSLSAIPSKNKSKPQSNSLFSSNNFLTTVVPSTVGVFSLLGGSIFAWFKVRKTNRLFKSYLQRIGDAEEDYGRKKNLKAYKSALQNIQEEAELAAANKKINQEHLTAISSQIKRKNDSG